MTGENTEQPDPDVKQPLIDLIAIIRDRQLGYPSEDIHMDPVDAIENGLEVLDELGTNPDEVVFPDDQETLGIEKTWSEQTQAEN